MGFIRVINADVSNVENTACHFDNHRLHRHDHEVSGRKAILDRRQSCRPFSLTRLVICLARHEHLSTSSSATGEHPIRDWLPV